MEASACDLTKFHDITHHYGRIPSHRVSQKLPIGSFGRKLRGSPYGGIGVPFYDMEHQYGPIPSYRTSQRLSINRFFR